VVLYVCVAYGFSYSADFIIIFNNGFILRLCVGLLSVICI